MRQGTKQMLLQCIDMIQRLVACFAAAALVEEALRSGIGLDVAVQLWSLLAALCTLGAAGHATQSVPPAIYAALARTLAACSPSSVRASSGSHITSSASAVLSPVLTAATVVLQTLQRQGMCTPSFTDAVGLVQALSCTIASAPRRGSGADAWDICWLQAAHAVLCAATTALDPGNAILKVRCMPASICIILVC